MKAIRTKYLGATNTKDSRIKADDYDSNSITISYNYGLSSEDVFKEAAVALCKKMDWPTNLLGGGTDNGYVFVFKQQ